MLLFTNIHSQQILQTIYVIIQIISFIHIIDFIANILERAAPTPDQSGANQHCF